MAWDTEATKRRLLDAGARQFAALGLAGARIDAIAEDAGVNKERIYSYFGNKRAFFTAVLHDRLGELFDGLVVTGEGPRAVGEFAGTLFDRLSANPELARLLSWESLEPGLAVDADDRGAACAAQVADLATALPGVPVRDVAQLLLTAVTLAVGWSALGHLSALIAPHASSEDRRAAVIAQVVSAGARMRDAGDPGPSEGRVAAR